MKLEKSPKIIYEKLEKSRKLLIDLLEGFPEEDWFKEFSGKWSINDIVTHLIGWDELLLSQAKDWLIDKEPDNYKIIDENEYNRKYIAEHTFGRKIDTLEKFIISTENLLKFLKSLSPEQVRFALKNDSLVDLDLYNHDMEHYEQIKRLLKK